MNKSITFAASLLIVLVFSSGCQTTEGFSPERGTARAEETEAAWLRTELYFAIGLIPREGAANTVKLMEREEQWDSFLDETVTPLFPDGLTVFDAVGQWMGDRFEEPPRLATKVLVILHPDTEDANERIEAVRASFLELTGQESVLRVSQPAAVSF